MRNVFTLPQDLEQLGWLTTYPGMVAAESRPLRAFIQKYGPLFDEVRFNVRVGPGETAPADVDESLQRAIEQGTRMRLDCVMWKAPNFTLLVEAKQDAANDAVWQLQAYRDHYVAEHPDATIGLAIVAESATTSARALCRAHEITLALFTFPADTVDVSATPTEEITGGL